MSESISPTSVPEQPEAQHGAPAPAIVPAHRVPLLPLILFVLTVLTTLQVGIESSSSGIAILGLLSNGQIGWSRAALPLLLAGLPYVLALLGFFLAHEMGHYVACRLYRVDCTVPYFVPAPSLISLVGTFGALIRIRSPIPSRRALFDIGIAGPLAGFVVAVPVLVIGISVSRVAPSGPAPSGITILFGDSLLTWFLTSILRPEAGDVGLIADPVFLAGWVGLLATALNLIPAGQLDGGHILYALSPRAHRVAPYLTATFLLSMVATRGILYRDWQPPSLWILWAFLILLLGRRHPPPLTSDDDLGPGRRLLALLAAVILVLSFIPVPLSLSSGP